ncbi:hypothetical protein ABID70_002423 [Clavibacter michiganensis]|uniref:hypothetical protein n=1 Tax=Clavibacter michiganensis TaxID=28447 RepID=UPI001AE2CFE9|nr:hypothetical protein [Clavibacter michiganensis]MBP2456899.1 hypothetical protein [Clavibacter michiganensis]MDQ0409469.1 hypothetical protein [Clavibacter michiganensis]
MKNKVVWPGWAWILASVLTAAATWLLVVTALNNWAFILLSIPFIGIFLTIAGVSLVRAPRDTPTLLSDLLVPVAVSLPAFGTLASISITGVNIKEAEPPEVWIAIGVAALSGALVIVGSSKIGRTEIGVQGDVTELKPATIAAIQPTTLPGRGPLNSCLSVAIDEDIRVDLSESRKIRVSLNFGSIASNGKAVPGTGFRMFLLAVAASKGLGCKKVDRAARWREHEHVEKTRRGLTIKRSSTKLTD